MIPDIDHGMHLCEIVLITYAYQKLFRHMCKIVEIRNFLIFDNNGKFEEFYPLFLQLSARSVSSPKFTLFPFPGFLYAHVMGLPPDQVVLYRGNFSNDVMTKQCSWLVLM